MTIPNRLDRNRLGRQLAALGLPSGQAVLVHASLRALGGVEGGPATVVEALFDVVGRSGTVVVPAQTPNNSTTSRDFHRATSGLDPTERAAYIDSLPGFDAGRTPSYGMGAVAEWVRRHPASIRSVHPQTSFAALGPTAASLMAIHDLDCHLGERSPLGALYRDDATVVLLGVGYGVCTAFHLAEYRRPGATVGDYQCFVDNDGRREQRVFRALTLDDHDFEKLGEAYEQEGEVRVGPVGLGTARVLSMRPAVDFAIRWLGSYRWP